MPGIIPGLSDTGNANTDPDPDLIDLTVEVGKRTFIEEPLKHKNTNPRAVRERSEAEGHKAMKSGLAEGSLEKDEDHFPCLWGADPTRHRPSGAKRTAYCRLM